MQENKFMILGLFVTLFVVSGQVFARNGYSLGTPSGDYATQNRLPEMAPPPPGPYQSESLQMPPVPDYQEGVQETGPAYPVQQLYETYPPGYNHYPQSGQFQQYQDGYGYPQQPVYPGYMPYGYYPPGNGYR
ncbi:MAG TPA: hypothetical protein ENI65_07710 [Gammaproteobacteria bacterium]|nr:hypothetical protein [Gammaproteobacteria bacterium]